VQYVSVLKQMWLISSKPIILRYNFNFIQQLIVTCLPSKLRIIIDIIIIIIIYFAHGNIHLAIQKI